MRNSVTNYLNKSINWTRNKELTIRRKPSTLRMTVLPKLQSINNDQSRTKESWDTKTNLKIHAILKPSSYFNLDIPVTFIVCPTVVGYISSTSCFIAAVPLNRSNCVPGGSKPEKSKNGVTGHKIRLFVHLFYTCLVTVFEVLNQA